MLDVENVRISDKVKPRYVFADTRYVLFWVFVRKTPFLMHVRRKPTKIMLEYNIIVEILEIQYIDALLIFIY